MARLLSEHGVAVAIRAVPLIIMSVLTIATFTSTTTNGIINPLQVSAQLSIPILHGISRQSPSIKLGGQLIADPHEEEASGLEPRHKSPNWPLTWKRDVEVSAKEGVVELKNQVVTRESTSDQKATNWLPSWKRGIGPNGQGLIWPLRWKRDNHEDA
ncbi:hypothetical protein EDD11_009105 [Mortierella claussenii]|nr:hypothetical protein EDD11_009105 [Mortierella claussenii]